MSVGHVIWTRGCNHSKCNCLSQWSEYKQYMTYFLPASAIVAVYH